MTIVTFQVSIDPTTSALVIRQPVISTAFAEELRRCLETMSPTDPMTKLGGAILDVLCPDVLGIYTTPPTRH